MNLGAMGCSAVLGVATLAVLLKLHFDARSARAERAVRAADSSGPTVEPSRGALAVAYALMAAGALLVAAGVALVLRDPWETASAITIVAVLGGPAIFLVGESVLYRAGMAASRIMALVSLAVLAPIGFALPALVLAALAFAVLLVLLLAASGWFRLPSASVDDDTS